MTPEQLQQIDALLYKGQKIAAIKLWRQFVGSDLRDSKEAVEARCRELQVSDPVHFKNPASGCLGLVIFVLAVGAVIYSLPKVPALF